MAAQEPEALIDDLEDPFGDTGLPVLLDSRAGGCERYRVEQLQDQVLVLHLLGAFDAVLVRELTQLVDGLGLELGQCERLHLVVLVGREGAGVDARVAARSVVGAAAGVGGACRDAPRAAVRATSRPIAARWASFFVHGRLVGQMWFM